MVDPERVYTADEAAELLKLTRRAVITSGKRYGLCFVRGRQTNFLGKHLLELIEAMRYKPVNTSYQAAYRGGDAFERMLARVKKQRAEDAAHKAAKAAARREESLQRQRAKAEARRQAKEAKAAARKAKQESEATPQPAAEPLDYKNRDPAYWTAERKKRLRLERAERMKQ